MVSCVRRCTCPDAAQRGLLYQSSDPTMCKHTFMLAEAVVAPLQYTLHRSAPPTDRGDAPAPFPKTFCQPRAKAGKGVNARLAHGNLLHPTATVAHAVRRQAGAQPAAASRGGGAATGAASAEAAAGGAAARGRQSTTATHVTGAPTRLARVTNACRHAAHTQSVHVILSWMAGRAHVRVSHVTLCGCCYLCALGTRQTQLD